MTRWAGKCKDLRQLCREKIAQGWRIELTNGGHLRWTWPATGEIVFTSQTPSDWRALKNIKKRLSTVESGGSLLHVRSA